MIKIGNYNELEVVKKVDFGFYLDGEEYGEILMPQKYAPEELKIGDMQRVSYIAILVVALWQLPNVRFWRSAKWGFCVLNR